MILVDTSVWIAHLRRADEHLQGLLEDGRVLVHPMVLGEVACGSLGERTTVLEFLSLLPSSPEATHEEALTLIEQQRLMARGIGYVDVHLLASVLLADGMRLWTLDARLARAAARLFVSYHPDR